MAEADGQNDLRAKIMAIMRDTTLSDAEKAVKRQQLMCGGWSAAAEKKQDTAAADTKIRPVKAGKGPDSKGLLEDTLKCVICFGLCERPVTGPCQHNFCLACFKRWSSQGKKTCPTCRTPFPAKFIENPRINTLLTYAIRCAKQGIKTDALKPVNRIADDSRPAEAFTTERAVRNGRANAASGRIMVNVPNDHFGPILPEHDPSNGKGVQVGDWWKDRLDCRQWGAHFPHVAGIAGQSNRGAQSVVLSGGYEDDHDEGEWFLYTGSGGRDLSGNKRTNKTQSFDQDFENMNKALKISCLKGLPVRVVRSFKEKRSSYAPSQQTPVRYDGIYRILRCWRKAGAQGFLMCRYLFVRCDNTPAPWTSDESGDPKRLEVPELAAKEIKQAKGPVHAIAANAYWDCDSSTGVWGWLHEAPPSQKAPGGGDAVKRLKKKASAHERLLKDFSCSLCKSVLDAPISMPCGHNFCKGCLDNRFAALEQGNGSKALADAQPARTLRVRKVPKPCPSCKIDIADYMSHAAVNTEMAELIRRLQEAAEAARKQAEHEAQGLDEDQQTDEAAEAEGEEAGDSDAAGSDPDEGDKQAAQSDATASNAEQVTCKRQCLTAAPSAAENAADGDSGSSAAAAVSIAAAAGSAPAAARYAVELAQLCKSFSEFDKELIAGLLEDQGGDFDEVHAYLKRMKNQLAHGKRQAARKQKAAANGAPADDGGSKAAIAAGEVLKGKGKSGTGAAKAKQQDGATAAQDAKQQQQQEDPFAADDSSAGSAGSKENAAPAVVVRHKDEANAHDAAAAGKIKGSSKAAGRKRATAAEGARACKRVK